MRSGRLTAEQAGDMRYYDSILGPLSKLAVAAPPLPEPRRPLGRTHTHTPPAGLPAHAQTAPVARPGSKRKLGPPKLGTGALPPTKS